MLRVVEMGGPRYPKRCLTIDGTSTVIPLNFFRLSEVRQACTVRGWQFWKAQVMDLDRSRNRRR